MLTCAVFAVVITAPAGAIFINTLGTKWLVHDVDPNAPIEDQKNKEAENTEDKVSKVSDDKDAAKANSMK